MVSKINLISFHEKMVRIRSKDNSIYHVHEKYIKTDVYECLFSNFDEDIYIDHDSIYVYYFIILAINIYNYDIWLDKPLNNHIYTYIPTSLYIILINLKLKVIITIVKISNFLNHEKLTNILCAFISHELNSII